MANEVRKAVRAIRTGSAAGPDRITVLKRKAEEMPGFLWLMTGRVPEKLKASRSLLLPKGTTDMLNIGNWHPLSISSVLLRLYEDTGKKANKRNQHPPLTVRLHSCSRSQAKLGSTRALDMKTEEGKAHPSCGIPGSGESLQHHLTRPICERTHENGSPNPVHQSSGRPIRWGNYNLFNSKWWNKANQNQPRCQSGWPSFPPDSVQCVSRSHVLQPSKRWGSKGTTITALGYADYTTEDTWPLWVESYTGCVTRIKMTAVSRSYWCPDGKLCATQYKNPNDIMSLTCNSCMHLAKTKNLTCYKRNRAKYKMHLRVKPDRNGLIILKHMNVYI